MVSFSVFAANGWHGLQTILDNSRSSYAQLLAASSLLKVVTEQSLRCVTASPHRIWNRPHMLLLLLLLHRLSTSIFS